MSEEWKQCVLGGEVWPYEVSSQGRIRSLSSYHKNRKERIVKPTLRNHGYLGYFLSNRGQRKNLYMHTIMAEVFHGPRPDGHVINHLNGIKTDNRAENLQYCTHVANHRHADRTGLRKRRGANNANSKLRDVDIEAIKALLAAEVLSQEKIGEIFGVSQTCISMIYQGKSWICAENK